MPNFLANSNNQKLSQHLIAVGNLSRQILNHIKVEDFQNLDKILFLSGLFHDLGKVDPHFQNFINKKIDSEEDNSDGFHQSPKDLEKRATHNELSWAILKSSKVYFNNNELTEIEKNFIEYGVFWHHKKLIRKNNQLETVEDFLSSLGHDYSIFLENISKIISEINEEYEAHFESPLGLRLEFLSLNKDSKIPPFKQTKDPRYADGGHFVQENMRKTLVRSILIRSDRSISNIDGKRLNECFQSKGWVNKLENRVISEHQDVNISEQINSGLSKFYTHDNEERNKKQLEAADKLIHKKFAILAGPPGCGKTKIALEKFKIENPKQIIWVCPRVNICLSVFEEIYRDYLPNLTAELYTGEYKLIKKEDKAIEPTSKDEFLSGKVIVTTIDQVLSLLVKNGKTGNLPDVLNSSFVFDEFHEIFQIPSMFFLFKELLYMFNKTNTKTLLMSATPNPTYLSQLLIEGFNEDRDLVNAWDFHDKPFNVAFSEDFPLIREEKENQINIHNIINEGMAQYRKDSSSSLLFHSGFTKNDKKTIYNEAFNSFGKNGIYGPKRHVKNYSHLRAGPIVQASLNISAKRMITDICSPENIMQRFGRCDRFGMGEGDFLVINNQSNANKSYLSRVEYSFDSSKAFFTFLKSSIKGLIKRNELMDLYYLFHKDHKKTILKDFEKMEKRADEFLKKYEEVKFLSKNKKNVKIISGGLRGESVYILPVIARLEGENYSFEKYIYNPLEVDLEKIDKIDVMTISADDMDLSDCLNEFSKNVKKSGFESRYGEKYDKYNARPEILKHRAKNPKFPIFVSYDNEDLTKLPAINEDNIAIVYVPYEKNKKSYGLINLKNLK